MCRVRTWWRGPAVGLVLGGLVLAVAGCPRPAGTVSGKVTYKDQALRGGRVTFVTPSGSWGGNAEIKEDGTYTFDKVPPGQVNVAVDTRGLRPQATQPPAGVKMPGPPPEAAQYGPPVAKDAKERYVKIPDQYEKSETSGLTYTVTAGPQTFNIDLK